MPTGPACPRAADRSRPAIQGPRPSTRTAGAPHECRSRRSSPASRRAPVYTVVKTFAKSAVDPALIDVYVGEQVRRLIT